MISNFRLEQCSALADGGLSSEEEELVVDALVKDEKLQAAWARYHLIRDVMSSSAPVYVDPGFAHRVAGRIAEEPVVMAAFRKPKSFRKTAVGIALAASLAAVAVVGVQNTDGLSVLQPTVAYSDVENGGSKKAFTNGYVGKWDKYESRVLMVQFDEQGQAALVNTPESDKNVSNASMFFKQQPATNAAGLYWVTPYTNVTGYSRGNDGTSQRVMKNH